MAALILPSRRVVQPQGPVEVDWGSPLTRGLVFAHNPASGLFNLAEGRAPISSRNNTLGVSSSGVMSTGGEAEFAHQSSIANGLTLFAVMRARTSSQYLFADADRIALSSRNASNQGWSWGRTAASSGGSLGNVTKQAFTLQGVAAYSESTSVIDSYRDVPVATRYNKTTGVISWFADGRKSSADTTGSTGGSAGGNLIYRQAGPFSSTIDRYLDQLGVVFAFERTLSDAEIAALSENPWQIFQPTNRAIYPVAAGGGTGNATGSLASITIDAATGTATGKATATATPANVSITAPTATATGGAVGNATGALSSVTLAGPSATASGKAQATTTPASVTLVSPTATATGKGQASGALAAVSLVAPTGTASASAGGTGNAIATPASINIAPPGATATGAAAAFASFMSVVLTPVSGTASSGVIQVAGAVTRGRRTQDFGRTRRIANTTR